MLLQKRAAYHSHEKTTSKIWNYDLLMQMSNLDCRVKFFTYLLAKLKQKLSLPSTIKMRHALSYRDHKVLILLWSTLYWNKEVLEIKYLEIRYFSIFDVKFYKIINITAKVVSEMLKDFWNVDILWRNGHKAS